MSHPTSQPQRGNTRKVVAFEVARTIRKRSFWVLTFLLPVLIGVVYLIVFFASQTAARSVTEQEKATFSFEYTDASGLVDASIAQAAGGKAITQTAQGLADVKAGRVAAFFAYPKNVGTEKIEVAGQDVGLFNSNKYSAVAQSVLQASVEHSVNNPAMVKVLSDSVPTEVTTYKNGQQTSGVGSLLPPLIFPLLFFLLVVLQGNQMLTSILEEKENRVTEMILTTIRPNRFLLGKIISLAILGLIQLVIYAIPFIIILTSKSDIAIAGFPLDQLVFNPQRMIIGALFLISAYALYATTLITVGVIMPTVKEAGPVFSVVVICSIIPLYLSALLISSPQGAIAQVFTFIPYTSPITSMVRNAIGGLPLWEGIIAIVELLALSAGILAIATRLFRTGSVSYGRRLKLSAARK